MIYKSSYLARKIVETYSNKVYIKNTIFGIDHSEVEIKDNCIELRILN